MERKPFNKPKVVVVETPQVWIVNGKVLSSDSQPKLPAVQVKTLLDWQVCKPAPKKVVVVALVVEALTAEKLVVVALVEVELRAVKFCKVEEEKTVKFLAERSVVEAVMAFKVTA